MNDRRVAVRHDSTQATPCHYALANRVQSRWGKVRDISRTGIALEMDVLFSTGTRLIVELPARSYKEIRPIAVDVVRTQELADGAWLIGCAFALALTADDESLFR